MSKPLDLHVGAWNDLPHFACVGEPTKFYVYLTNKEYPKGQHSTWFKGSQYFSTYQKLKHLHKKDKKGFCVMISELLNENKG
jgi:hypothetical protein